jgi:hypothetical protein
VVKKGVRNVVFWLLAVSLIVGGGLFDAPAKAAAAPENLAYLKPVTVSSMENSTHVARNAVNANGNTRWSSSYADQQYIIVDLGTSRTVAAVRLAWEAAYARQFQVQTSTNNSTWTTDDGIFQLQRYGWIQYDQLHSGYGKICQSLFDSKSNIVRFLLMGVRDLWE